MSGKWGRGGGERKKPSCNRMRNQRRYRKEGREEKEKGRGGGKNRKIR